ncbi:MAG: uroporphyrinogen decarboxylase family protein [Planctomycetota bacterium]
MLTPKQNALEIMTFGKPDRVTGGPPEHGICYTGCNHEGFTEGGHHLPVGSHWTDIWGVGWHKEYEGVMGFPKGNPLADLPAALKSYRWPDPDDERIIKKAYDLAAAPHDPAAVFLKGANRDTLWEKAYMLVGMENLMCFLITEPNAVRELLHRIIDFQMGIARHYLKLGVEMVGMSDDLGSQAGPLFSPEVLREFFVPEYRRLFNLYKQHGVRVNFHSCGNIVPVVDVFMELGVDILNPVQATANDLDELRRKTQGRMALQGGVSSGTIEAGPPAKIRAEAATRLWQLGRDGGYFCGPDQGVPWPEAHIQALRDAVDELGVYPLRDPAASSASARKKQGALRHKP